MVFLLSFSAISIANRGSGWDGQQGGLGDRKMPYLQHLMSSRDTHTQYTCEPQSHWEQTQVPTAQLVPSMGATVPSMTLEGQQHVLQKGTLVNI